MEKRGREIKHIPRNHQIVLGIQKEKQEQRKENIFFGKKQIDLIVGYIRNSEGSRKFDKEIKSEIRVLKEIFKFTFRKLSEMRKKKNTEYFSEKVINYFLDICNSFKEGQIIVEKFTKEGKFELENFLEYFEKSHDMHFIYNFFVEHIRRMEMYQSKFELYFESVKENYITKIIGYINEGEIPESVLNRIPFLKKTHGTIFDFFRDLDFGYLFEHELLAHASADGYIEHGLNVFMLGELKDDEMLELQDTLNHEFFHIISGIARKYNRKRDKLSELRFGINKQNNFDWLNEAITEFFTLHFFPNKNQHKDKKLYGSNVYVDERAEFHEIFGKFVEKHMVNIVGAYFEDIDNSVHPKIKGVYFKKLVSYINKYGLEVHGIKNYFNYINKKFLAKYLVREAVNSEFLYEYDISTTRPEVGQSEKLIEIRVFPFTKNERFAKVYSSFYLIVTPNMDLNKVANFSANLKKAFPGSARFSSRVYNE